MTFEFSTTAPCADAIFYRSYSRVVDNKKESFNQMCTRTVKGLAELGKLSKDEANLIDTMQRQLIATSSGRWMWVGGTEWSKKLENAPGNYNCSSQKITSWHSVASMMDLASQGCGTGCTLELEFISQLPAIRHILELEVVGNYGDVAKDDRLNETELISTPEMFKIIVGDSRQGWVKSYQYLFEIASSVMFAPQNLKVVVDVSNVRPVGEPLKGFGGVANPTMLKDLYYKIAKILNNAQGRKLDSVELSRCLGEAALVIVVGNVRRSASIYQFSSDDLVSQTAKDNLWVQDEVTKKWSIDPDRDCLRMANHTRVFHCKPDLDTVKSAVAKQYYSGEGAIQWAGEAVARANADILSDKTQKDKFLRLYDLDRRLAKEYLSVKGCEDEVELNHRMSRYLLNPCGEIIQSESFCNLSAIHANQLDPLNFSQQDDAFKAGGLIVASLLHHKFEDERFQQSRKLDPLVGVSVTGIFDFFVNLFGVEWLLWWQDGRPEYWNADRNSCRRIIDKVVDACCKYNVNMGNQTWQYSSDLSVVFTEIERFYLSYWKEVVEQTVQSYCYKHDLRVPNRCTTVQPSGSVALMTNSSPGWHPPKAVYYIRRMTFKKDDPIALACLDMGYSVIPSVSDKDAEGNLLDNPFDERCTEWLVEFPVKTNWADLPGVDAIDISKFSITAQYSFYMQVQKYYVTHNSSATLELRESEIDTLSKLIYDSIENDEGYISTAILARFDDAQTFPRLPFEPIDKATYQQLVSYRKSRRTAVSFGEAIVKHWISPYDVQAPAGCDSDKCTLPIAQPK